VAISLGGYYAPRCASLEPRFAACIAWGAIWDYYATWKKTHRRHFKDLAVGARPSHHVDPGRRYGRGGAETKLEPFRLDGVVQKMRCPFLVVHGADDEQVPLADAQALYEACGSQDKTLRVFTAEEGGAQHCQRDYLTWRRHDVGLVRGQAGASEVRDGMRIDWDVPIHGRRARAARRRLPAGRRGPLSGHPELRPLRQGLAFQDGYKTAWEIMAREIPTRWPARPTSTRTGKSSIRRNGCRTAMPASGSTRAAPAARRDTSTTTTRARPRLTSASNGPRRSPGATARWGSTASRTTPQPVAGRRLQPPHLAAICVWEGLERLPRVHRHGGIACTFRKNWQEMQVKTVQHGVGERARSR
jgi:hypothetical protein